MLVYKNSFFSILLLPGLVLLNKILLGSLLVKQKKLLTRFSKEKRDN